MTRKELLWVRTWHKFSSDKKSTTAPILAGAALLCSGCAFHTQTARMAVDHNEFVAQTTNRQTVLNILRAREREPIHYTTFGPVSGTMRATGAAGLNPVFNEDGGSVTNTGTSTLNAGPTGTPTGSVATTTITEVLTEGATNWTPSVSVGVNTGTDFQVVTNATQEFYRGILGPLSSNLVVHFLRQGYPPDLLSHIVIAEVQFTAKLIGPNGEEHLITFPPIHNAPDEALSAAAFAAAIRCRQLSYSPRPVPERKLPVAALSDLAGIDAAVLGRVRAAPSDAAPYQLLTPARTEFDLALTPPDAEGCVATRALLNRRVAEWVATQNLRPRGPQADSSGPADQPLISSQTSPTAAGGASRDLTLEGGPSFGAKAFFDQELPPGWTSELLIDMTFRSVEGIIYYLGEYVRDESTSPMLRDLSECPVPPHECIPVLRIRPLSQVPAAQRFADVSYRGRAYAVPLSGRHIGPEAGRSSQAIALVQQLLNLHRSASDAPTTPLVRVIN
jgi:hypothetical protein